MQRKTQSWKDLRESPISSCSVMLGYHSMILQPFLITVMLQKCTLHQFLGLYASQRLTFFYRFKNRHKEEDSKLNLKFFRDIFKIALRGVQASRLDCTSY
ncbi:hypothetical protein Tco_0419291 [Tanacetum coccineum]